MGLTKEYLRYVPAGVTNVVASANSGLISLKKDNIVVVGACQNVVFWNTKTAEKVGVINGEEEGVYVSMLSYSGAGSNRLAVGYSDGSVKIFSEAGEEIVVFSGHRVAVSALSFSHTSLLLGTGGKDSVVIIWDIVSEAGLYRLNGHKGPVTQLKFTADGKYIISSSKDSMVKFWDLSSQHCFYTIANSLTEVWDFVLVKNDSLLITGSSELELRVYALEWIKGALPPSKDGDAEIAEEGDGNYQNLVRSTKLGSLLRQTKGRASQLSVSPDERILLCQGTGQFLDVYRIFNSQESEKKIQRKLKKAQKRRKTQDVDNKEAGTLSESLRREIMRDLSSQCLRLGGIKMSAKAKSSDFLSFYQDLGGRLKYKICVLMGNNCMEEVELWEESNGLKWEGRERLRSVGHKGPIRCLSFSQDNSILSGGEDGLRLWNRDSLRCLRTMEAHQVLCSLIVPGDRHCVAGTKHGELNVFDLGSGELLESQKGHTGAVWSMALASDQKSMASCGADKKVKFWNFDLVSENDRSRLSLVNTRTLEVSDDVLCVGFSDNGKFLAVGLLDNTAKVYFADTLKFFLSLYGHSLPVLCLDMSWDTKLVITGSADKNVKIWGLDFGDCHKSLFAHDDSVTSLRFLHKTHTFFSAGKDGKIKHWDADKFLRIQVLNGHHMEIWGLAVSRTGSFVVSASHDRTIRLWERSEELLILEEEQEIEREEAYEKGVTEQEDVIPGERAGESGLASKKTVATVKATEVIVDAVDIVRGERVERVPDPNHLPHPMISSLGSVCLDSFILDMIKKIPSSNLEKCLLMVPFGYVLDVLKSLAVCIQKNYNIELAGRVIFFLMKINHNQMVNSAEAVQVIEKLKNSVPGRISTAKDLIGQNLAALRFLQMNIEEKEDIQIFAESFQKVQSKKQKKKRLEAYRMSVA